MSRVTGQGSATVKRCLTCDRPVLSYHRGQVVPAAPGRIESVEKNGDVVGRCQCGRRVTWMKSRPKPPQLTVG